MCVILIVGTLLSAVGGCVRSGGGSRRSCGGRCASCSRCGVHTSIAERTGHGGSVHLSLVVR